MWFALDEEVVELDPDREPPAVAPPQVLIDELAVDGRVEPIAPEVRLAAAGHRLEWRFAAPMYAKPARLGFRYRLLGVDADSQLGGEDHAATYTDPPPGTFAFTVEALLDGAPSGQRATVQLTVPPRYYQTAWFRVGVGVLALLALGGAVRIRGEVLRSRARSLEAEVAARTQELEVALCALKEAQVELVRAEQLAPAATLVRGIAHELNNPLGQVAGNLPPLRRYAAFLVKAAEGLASRFAGTKEELAALTQLSPRKDLQFVARDLEVLTGDMSSAATRARHTSATCRASAPRAIGRSRRSTSRAAWPRPCASSRRGFRRTWSCRPRSSPAYRCARVPARSIRSSSTSSTTRRAR